MSERLKEPVLKTGDVRASVGSNPTLSSTLQFNICKSTNSQSFRRWGILSLWRSTQVGRRGAPAKGVGRETGARVQIPPSPPEIDKFRLVDFLYTYLVFLCYKKVMISSNIIEY